MDYAFFENLLKERKKKLEDSLFEKNEILREWNNSHFSDDGDVVAASAHGNKTISIMELQKKEIQEIEHSLEKIKNKTYGICEMCDEEISIERLKIKPHAKYCIQCREYFEKTQHLQDKFKNLKTKGSNTKEFDEI
ncbi:RNA polymerase-binding protein DksA [Helicobacter sp. MIT 00-7814]|uniref:RNA polymerase-binding protein DksA n=1 Tax=unclassified Helicobacter TaxID=2593540 RepID=UPI000E1F9A83|nr:MULTISPECIES: RNA polymerase-binding protein DksA [unclassified Helicobacter]RDU55860.1 RNA polymerase-binding protein DksA [Helicobacter sp. MIT 00-7814]RDU56818.1 RNA polymerase-binding protein DksA [Helicobacter sp. MIT 99-10781]